MRNLLDFARQSVPALKETDINEVIKRALELVVNSAQLIHIEVVKELSPCLPKLMADPEQLHQVCINLILNAIQAMSGGGTLTLRTLSENGQVRVEVEDTGCGIPPENMSKLFTPFLPLKKK